MTRLSAASSDPFSTFSLMEKKMSLPVSSLDSEKWDLPQAGERPLNLRSDSDEESTLWRLCINVNSRNTYYSLTYRSGKPSGKAWQLKWHRASAFALWSHFSVNESCKLILHYEWSHSRLCLSFGSYCYYSHFTWVFLQLPILVC